MATTVEEAKRVFKLGAATLEDPAPNLPPLEAVRLYQGTYPYLAQSTLDGPEVADNTLVYTVRRPPAQTKG